MHGSCRMGAVEILLCGWGGCLKGGDEVEVGFGRLE